VTRQSGDDGATERGRRSSCRGARWPAPGLEIPGGKRAAMSSSGMGRKPGRCKPSKMASADDNFRDCLRGVGAGGKKSTIIDCRYSWTMRFSEWISDERRWIRQRRVSHLQPPQAGQPRPGLIGRVEMHESRGWGEALIEHPPARYTSPPGAPEDQQRHSYGPAGSWFWEIAGIAIESCRRIVALGICNSSDRRRLEYWVVGDLLRHIGQKQD